MIHHEIKQFCISPGTQDYPDCIYALTTENEIFIFATNEDKWVKLPDINGVGNIRTLQ